MKERPTFTPRQIELLQLLAAGKTEPEMAQILGLSPRTVHNIIKRQFPKLGASTRPGLVWAAMAHGLIEPPAVFRPLPFPAPTEPPKPAHIYPKHRLLALLRRHAGVTLRLCDLEQFGDAQGIRQLICRLRKDLPDHERIVRVVGVGYRLEQCHIKAAA